MDHMMPPNGKSKSVRAGRSLVLQVVLLAFVALSQANAAFNGPYPFTQGGNPSPTTSYIDFDDDNCYNNQVAQQLGGAVTNGGSGLTLYGGAGIYNNSGTGAYSCQLNFVWQGTASGTVGTTSTISSNFTFTYANISNFSCSLTIYANGSQVAQYNCVEPTGTAFTLTNQTFTVPANWTSWKVVLATSESLSSSAPASFVVNIPGGASIDIGTTPTTAAVPALTPAALGTTAIMLALLAGYATLRRCGSGFPGSRG